MKYSMKKIVINRSRSTNFLLITLVLIIISRMVIANQSLELLSTQTNFRGDTIEFSGYKWEIKESNGKHTGPGNNFFSSSRENVFVDSLGKLHLRMTVRNEKWYCAEVRMIKTLGYGKYVFHIDSLVTPLDKDIVAGFFLYDRGDSMNYHKEVDVEFSKWGKENSNNSQYVIQPKEAEAYRFNNDFSKRSIHTFALRKNKISFKSAYPDENKKIFSKKNYSHWCIKPEKTYESKNERVSINVWLYRMIEPSNLKEFEIVISKFEFIPFKFGGILNPKPADN